MAVQNACYDASEFAEIAPYSDEEFNAKMRSLVEEPMFQHVIKCVMPDIDYDAFKHQLVSCHTKLDFQYKIMSRFLEMLVSKTTSGLSIDGLENIDKETSYTFISNHRDIVLDASLLSLCFYHEGYPVTQIAIGNNLLIYDWITDLVKLNGSFIVKRDTKITEALAAAKQLSGYIHYCIGCIHQSVWIAQREGRSKDSSDLTQESLIKMLSLTGDQDTKGNLTQINLCPVSISYEYDPNDYLKAKEYLLKRRDADYKKSQFDDLLSMETGILGYKGHVHFHVSKCINETLENCTETNRNAVIKVACSAIDKSIHAGYKLYAINYVAYDQLEGTTEFADKYTSAEADKVNQYLNGQLDKVDLPDITAEEREYMRTMILTMYANPVKNLLQTR